MPTGHEPMSRALRRVVVALIIVAALPLPAPGCSIFTFTHDGRTFYGRNLDWSEAFPGAVVVNPRGIAKEVLPWKGVWPTSFDGEPVVWVARYGSVTFTCYGRDFVEGGLNEAGLTVDQTSLAAVYPPADDRAGVSCAQWIQYQLDNHATVEEVLLHLDDVRPDGEGWHYLISDAGGDRAVIEYLDGGPTVYGRERLEISALTNTTWKQALSHIPMDRAFGGTLDIGAGHDSYGRFVRMAALMRDYDPTGEVSPVEYAFRILEEVSVHDTIRSVVYEADRPRVSWRTLENREVRTLDFADLDLSEGASVLMLDVEAGGPGDVSALLEDYSIAANRAIVSGVRDAGERGPEAIAELESRGLTFHEALEMIAAHPTSTGGHE